MTTDVHVLGGGLIGMAVAHRLARRGCMVQVLSRQRREAAGFVAAGMLAPHAEGLSGALLELGQRSLRRIPSWVGEVEADSGLQCGFRTSGIVALFRSAVEQEAYPTAHFGRALDRTGLEKELPGIGEAWTTGLIFPQDGQIDSRRCLMQALETACIRLGVQFQESAEIVRLVSSKSGLDAIELRDINGQERTLTARCAVLCCGAWTNCLMPELPIFPVKGQMLSLQAPRGAVRRVIFGPEGTYLVPRDDGLVVVGATSERQAGFEAELTSDGQKHLKERMLNLLPEADKWPLIEQWWGFRPGTPDEGPLIGKSATEGLWLATGHYRNGVLLAAVTADLLSADLLGDVQNPEESALLRAFRWDRFQ
ncbi:glycine oxidase ThiO [cyanobiont of Ornithocercus magnificus]|nr:glycine oxidase ThiO [cyanobiont of Ornithocercus magnificus]